MDERLHRLLPMVVKAAIWGFIMGGEALIIYHMLGFKEMETFLPVEPPIFPGLMIFFILLEVAIQLLADTIFQHALGTARAIGTMIIMIHMSNGGVLTREISMDAGTIEVIIGYKPILAMFLAILLLISFKNILNAIDHLYQKSEKPVKT